MNKITSSPELSHTHPVTKTIYSTIICIHLLSIFHSTSQFVILYYINGTFFRSLYVLHAHREDFRFVNFRIYLVALGTFAIATDAFVIAGILPAIAQSF